MPIPPGRYELVFGNGADMRMVANGAADLVLTGPPYFSDTTEHLLKQPTKKQTEVSEVRRQLVQYALGLRPVFREIARVLKKGGALVLQTKDIRYGGFLLNVAGIHRELAESNGLFLVTQIHWQPKILTAGRHHIRGKVNRVGGFRAYETESFLVFGHSSGICPRDEKVQLSADDIDDSMLPLWRVQAMGGRKIHPHQSPVEALRRFVAFYTNPGELVVDPFAGGGTTVRVAVEMGRRAIGYEIVEQYITKARSWIDGREC